MCILILTFLRQQADGGGFCDLFTIHTPAHPVDDADVLPEARPEEFAVVVNTEPVDMKHLGHVAACLLEAQPVLQVVPEVVAKERTHGHRVVHDLLAWNEEDNGYSPVLVQSK